MQHSTQASDAFFGGGLKIKQISTISHFDSKIVKKMICKRQSWSKNGESYHDFLRGLMPEGVHRKLIFKRLDFKYVCKK